jgi:hypothetical protein
MSRAGTLNGSNCLNITGKGPGLAIQYFGLSLFCTLVDGDAGAPIQKVERVAIGGALTPGCLVNLCV